MEEEIRKVLYNKTAFLVPFFLDPALHIYPERLAEELKATLDGLSGSFNYFIIIYGHCHPHISDILGNYPVERIKASNCVEMILGKEDYNNELRKEPGTFFLTPGWCKIWRDMFIDWLKLNNKFEKVLFKNYKRALFIDVGITAEKYLSEAKNFADHFSLQFEEKNTDLKHLKGLLETSLMEIAEKFHFKEM